jgi:hypothetical protein
VETLAQATIAGRIGGWVVAILVLVIIAAGIWALVELLVLPRHRQARSEPSAPTGAPKHKDKDKAA